MVTETSTKVIDPEFAYYGPMGFDIGALFANLLLSYASHVGHTVDEEVRTSYQAWLLETIETIWHGFEEQFSVLWKEHVQDEMWRVPGYRERFLARVLQESAGFAGCKMLRRVIGLAPVADLETIEDPHVRAEAEVLALHIGQALIKRRKTLETIEQLTAWVREVTKEKVAK
jgi:5-methylthioribose kinase